MANNTNIKIACQKLGSACEKTLRPKCSNSMVQGSSKQQSVAPGGSARVTKLTHKQIAERAEAIWRASGCLPGRDEQNWCEAVAQLKAELGIA